MKVTGPGEIKLERRPPSGRWQITHRGKEVENPLLRRLIALSMILIVPVVMLLALFVCFFIALPLGLLLDKPLKLCGRRGCVIGGPNDTFSIQLDGNSFRRQPRTPIPPAPRPELAEVAVEPGVRSRPSGLAGDQS